MKALPCVATGVANVASVRAAFRRLGRELAPASAGDVADAPALVVPGVGHFGAAMRRLRAHGLVDPLRARLAAGRPTLGICLGMQLCCEGSEEAPGEPGLAAVAGTVTRFAPGVRCPQMGWNRVEAPADARFVEAGHAYFAHSFALARPPAGFCAATATHDAPFVAALERGSLLLCQFHPELSGAWGEALLARWLAGAAEASC